MKKIFMVLSLGAILTGCNENKTAYVDTTKLIQEFSEMKEVEAKFTTRSESLKKELDSVARGFQADVQEYQENMATMSQAERQAAEQELMQKQQMLQQQQQMRSGQLRQESDAVIDSLITKVKDFVKVYGEENDYTYIFGSNESANIMYAEEGLDITQEILEELNEGAVMESTEE
jgi:outer membrane protein